MKPNDIRRSVRSLQHDRSPGDAPNLGRVSRVPRAEQSSNTSRFRRSKSVRRREVSASRKRLIQLRIYIFSALALALLVVGVVYLSIRSAGRRDVVDGSSSEQLTSELSKYPSPSKEEALEFVTKALEVREFGSIAKFFRIDASRSQEVVDFLVQMESRDGIIHGQEWLSSIDANNLALDGVKVTFKGKDRFTNRIAILTPSESGTWKIDFDAFARTVSPDWKSILDLGTQSALVRVFVVKDTYYNGPFKDDKEWVCYGLATPDVDEILLGYCKMDSPQEAAMQTVLSKHEKLGRATLEIRRVESGGVRQFEISKVIAEDWVVTDSVFDASFADGQLRLPDPIR